MKTVLSMGGGMESTGVLALTILDARFAALRPSLVAFVDLGSEWAETYEHLRFVEDVCRREGIEYVRIAPEVLRGKRTFGQNRKYTKLYDYQWDMRAVPGKAPNGKRLCTDLFKVRPITGFLQERFPGEELTVLIGFGADEKPRIARGENQVDGWTNRFPLDEAGLCRCRTIEYLRSVGWPVPRRSGCTFCPFAKKIDFQVQAKAYPEEFARTVALERNNRRFSDPERPIYLKSETKPVDEWIMTPDVRRRRTCVACGREIDEALHTFGDSPLYRVYKERKTVAG